MADLTIEGEEVTDTGDLSEGDRITVIAHGDVTVEDVGSAYVIPDIEITTDDVVQIHQATITDIKTTFGGVPDIYLDVEGERGSSIPGWVRDDHVTVYKES